MLETHTEDHPSEPTKLNLKSLDQNTKIKSTISRQKRIKKSSTIPKHDLEAASSRMNQKVLKFLSPEGHLRTVRFVLNKKEPPAPQPQKKISEMVKEIVASFLQSPQSPVIQEKIGFKKEEFYESKDISPDSRLTMAEDIMEPMQIQGSTLINNLAL